MSPRPARSTTAGLTTDEQLRDHHAESGVAQALAILARPVASSRDGRSSTTGRMGVASPVLDSTSGPHILQSIHELVCLYVCGQLLLSRSIQARFVSCDDCSTLRFRQWWYSKDSGPWPHRHNLLEPHRKVGVPRGPGRRWRRPFVQHARHAEIEQPLTQECPLPGCSFSRSRRRTARPPEGSADVNGREGRKAAIRPCDRPGEPRYSAAFADRTRPALSVPNGRFPDGCGGWGGRSELRGEHRNRAGFRGPFRVGQSPENEQPVIQKLSG